MLSSPMTDTDRRETISAQAVDDQTLQTHTYTFILACEVFKSGLHKLATSPVLCVRASQFRTRLSHVPKKTRLSSGEPAARRAHQQHFMSEVISYWDNVRVEFIYFFGGGGRGNPDLSVKVISCWDTVKVENISVAGGGQR